MAALDALAVLDSPSEPEFDTITRLAALVLGAESSTISLVDDRRAWFKSAYCFDETEVPLERAICAIAMLSAAPTIVLDTHEHPIFDAHPATQGEGAIRFYAGAPLVTSDGHSLGMLCAFDTAPRETVSAAQIEALANLAAMVVERIEQRQHSRGLLQARDRAEAFLRTVVENLPAMVFVKDVETRRYMLVNREGCELVGKAEDDIVGRTDEELFAEGRSYWLRDEAALAADAPTISESEYYPPAGGQPVSLRTKRIAIAGPDRSKQFILGLSENVTEMRHAQAESALLLNYDALTGLRNRRSFLIELERRIATGNPFSLIEIDLNRFKSVNDRFGHLAGDETLSIIALRLGELADEGDTAARVGGDEFVMVVDPARAAHVVGTIVKRLCQPITLSCATVQVGASVGVASFPEDGRTGADLRQAADLAMYRAKLDRRDGACFYSGAMDAAARDRQALEDDLREALDTGQITTVYQPVLSAETGRITSAEALARWTHPVRGDVPPSTFIPIAEEAGLIETLGTAILRQACIDACSWPEEVRVAVNVSPQQIHSGRLTATLLAVLAETSLTPSRLQIEVTEGMFLCDEEQTFRQLDELHALNIQVLMDDFGTGYSSLSYFERFAFDKVKIDRAFIRNITSSRSSQAIVRAVIGLGKSLDMNVVAEGIETEEQMRFLVAAGCTHFQGFLFSKPVAAEVIAGLIKDGGKQLLMPCRRTASS